MPISILKARIQGPNETVISIVEDVLWLSTHPDPQATEKKEVRALMRGVKSDIFGGLVRNPPTTVDAFVAEATNIERVLAARSDLYHRLSAAPATISAFTASRHDLDSLDRGAIPEVAREVLPEELRKMLPNWERPALVSVAEVVREGVQRALIPEIAFETVS